MAEIDHQEWLTRLKNSICVAFECSWRKEEVVAGYALLVRTEEVVLAFFQVQVIQVVQEPGRWCSVRCRWGRRRSPQE